MEKGPGLLIVFENGKLKGKLGEQPYFELLAEGESNFFIKGMDGDVFFTRSETKDITGINMVNNGRTLHFDKVK
jgi:hypothetical protein